MEGKKGWINWRVFWIVLIALFVVLPLLAFLAQRLITPG
jgi:predicted Na+-dependent transporter